MLQTECTARIQGTRVHSGLLLDPIKEAALDGQDQERWIGEGMQLARLGTTREASSACALMSFAAALFRWRLPAQRSMASRPAVD